MGSGYSKMKKQAKMMQSQMGQIRQDLQNKTFLGSSGAGLVTIELDGEKVLKKISINPECLQDVEALQDLIIAAFQDAATKADAQAPLGFGF